MIYVAFLNFPQGLRTGNGHVTTSPEIMAKRWFSVPAMLVSQLGREGAGYVVKQKRRPEIDKAAPVTGAA
jgi:hypothetical protein